MAKACPVLHFRTTKLPLSPWTEQEKLRAFNIEAFTPDGYSAGAVTLMQRNKTSPRVSAIQVTPALQRCGVATQLYQRAAAKACSAFRKPLHSDFERSKNAQAFWTKQEQKGRAICVERSTHAPDPGTDGPRLNRNGCVQYKLTCPAPRDLSARRRQRR